MRLLVLLSFLFALDLYAFQAVRTLGQHWAASTRQLVFGGYWALTAAVLLFMALYSAGAVSSLPKGLLAFIRAFIFILYFSKFLMAGVLFIDDFRRVVAWVINQFSGDPSFDSGRSRFLSTLGVALGSIPLITLTYGMIRNPYRYKLYRNSVAIKGLPAGLSGLKIVQISDIHSGSFLYKEPVRQAIDLINAQDPDLVFFTGDLVNNRADEMDDFIDVFDKIRSRHGTFSIFGNHDYGDYMGWPSAAAKQENMDKMVNNHKLLGWDLLRNEHRMLEINGEKLAVIGVENYSTHPRFPQYGDLGKAYAGSENAALKLLLSHDPTHWKSEVLNTFQDIAITFSGHTHGMQFGIEIPGFLKWSPVQYVYKQWAGLYQQAGQYLYVNRGLGFLGYPGRVGILPEISLIELVPA